MKLFLTILALIFFTSCTLKNKIPKGILSQIEMRSIIWDLMRADEFVGSYVMKDSSLDRKMESAKLYEQVFRIHRISQEVFKKSLFFYQSRPDLLKVITDSLHLNEKYVMEDQYKGSKPIPHDSLTKKSKIRSSPEK